MKNLFAVAFLVALVQPVMAGASDVTLTLGKFSTDGKSASQLIVAKNSGPPIFDLVIECAFLRGSELLTTGRDFALSVQTGQTAYLNIIPDERIGSAAGADHTDCRVFAAFADMNAIKADAKAHGVDLDNLGSTSKH